MQLCNGIEDNHAPLLAALFGVFGQGRVNSFAIMSKNCRFFIIIIIIIFLSHNHFNVQIATRSSAPCHTRRSVPPHTCSGAGGSLAPPTWATCPPPKAGAPGNRTVRTRNGGRPAEHTSDDLSKFLFGAAGHEWLQFDLGPPTQVTGLITRGQGDRKSFVTSYTVSYSNNSVSWHFYKDADNANAKVSRWTGDRRRCPRPFCVLTSSVFQSDRPFFPRPFFVVQVFGGNMDKNTERRHYLNDVVVARYVRFHPLTWHKKIGMRAAILGCRRTTGTCGPGFMQVNSGSSCSKSFRATGWANNP